MKVCMVGHGAFAKKHLDGLKRIQGAEVISICGRTAETMEQVAGKYGIPHWTTYLDEALARLHQARQLYRLLLVRPGSPAARRLASKINELYAAPVGSRQ